MLPRVATVYQDPAPHIDIPPDSAAAKSMKGYDPDVDYNSLAYRRCEMGSGSSHTNARGMAQLYSMLIQDTPAFGPRLLTNKTLQLASHEAAAGDDPVVLTPMRYSTGFELTCPPALPLGISDTAFGYIGAGGSLAFADPEYRLSVGYAANFMHMGLGTRPLRATPCRGDARRRKEPLATVLLDALISLHLVVGHDACTVFANDPQQPANIVGASLFAFAFDIGRREIILNVRFCDHLLAIKQPFERIHPIVKHGQLSGHRHDNSQELIHCRIVEECRAFPYVSSGSENLLHVIGRLRHFHAPYPYHRTISPQRPVSS